MNSYISHIKQQMISTRQQTVALLGWTEKEFFDFQFKMGTQFLQSYISVAPDAIDALVASSIFWNWWRNEWMIRDMKFLIEHAGPETGLVRMAIVEMYKRMHSVEGLNLAPEGCVMEEGYCKMIGSFNKSLS